MERSEATSNFATLRRFAPRGSDRSKCYFYASSLASITHLLSFVIGIVWVDVVVGGGEGD